MWKNRRTGNICKRRLDVGEEEEEERRHKDCAEKDKQEGLNMMMYKLLIFVLVFYNFYIILIYILY